MCHMKPQSPCMAENHLSDLQAGKKHTHNSKWKQKNDSIREGFSISQYKPCENTQDVSLTGSLLSSRAVAAIFDFTWFVLTLMENTFFCLNVSRVSLQPPDACFRR